MYLAPALTPQLHFSVTLGAPGLVNSACKRNYSVPCGAAAELQLSGYMVNSMSTRSLHLYTSVNPITKATKLLYQLRTTTHSRNHLVKMDQDPWHPDLPNPTQSENDNGGGVSTLLLVFIPVLVVVLTVLVGMVVFLIVVLYMRRKRGIR